MNMNDYYETNDNYTFGEYETGTIGTLPFGTSETLGDGTDLSEYECGDVSWD